MRSRRIPEGFGFPVGGALAVVATCVAVAVGATRQPVLSVLAQVVVIDVIALFSTVPAVVLTAVVCWFLHSGFLLGRHGELVFTEQSVHDAYVLGVNALVVALLVALARAAVAPLHEREHDPSAPRIPVQRRGGPVLTESQR